VTVHAKRPISLLLALLPLLVPPVARADGPDPAVTFENARVRVLAPRYAPGEGRPLHEHPPRVVIALAAGRVRQTLPDGTWADLDLPAGSVRFAGPVRHAVANAGNGELRLIEVELLRAEPAGSAPVCDPQADARHLTVEIDNELVRVVRLHLGARELSLPHRHGEYLSIALTETNTLVTGPEGGEDARGLPAGRVVWRPPGQYVVENLSDLPYESLSIELKPAVR